MNIHFASRSLIAIPILWLISMYACWIGAAKTLGRQPRPVWDDPKGIDGAWSGFYDVSWLFYSPGLPICFVAAAGLIAYFLAYRPSGWKAGLSETVIGAGLLVGLVFFGASSFEFVRWYFD